MNKFVFFLSLLFSTLSFAESVNFKDFVMENRERVKLIRVNYIPFQEQHLANLYKTFVLDDAVVSKNTEMVQRTMRENTHVKDWTKVPAGKKVKLYISLDVIDFDKLKAYKKSIYDKVVALKNKSDKIDQANNKLLPKGLKASVFYMASYGKFTQSNPAQANITFLQNSPISLGLAVSFYPENKNYSFSSSVYFSYLLTAGNNINNQDVSIPLEIGGNIYGEYQLKRMGFSVYGGLDFEKMSTFNLEGVRNERIIYVDESSIGYLTVGASRSFSLMNKTFFTKLSFSKSIFSTRDVSYAASVDHSSFEGSKILWYLFHKINDRYFVHSLFKYHWMSGPSDLTVTRIGVGFGYILF
ncbi:hypothetical protein [Bacteriovorax sp. BSW11_IV]|uniref:hypothetical protein n=1 Tax=Bacteriovorax sp. BSW11_IV TaxID=1353529 RepID=UPI000552D6B8|nr:hypothetical protein [Bacteriovorax sp. BSW11_IV]